MFKDIEDTKEYKDFINALDNIILNAFDEYMKLPWYKRLWISIKLNIGFFFDTIIKFLKYLLTKK